MKMRLPKVGVSVLLLAILLSLCACGAGDTVSNTVLKFAFSADTPSDVFDEKTIFINEDLDTLELGAKLKLDGGSLAVRITELSSGEIVWSGIYTETGGFRIELTDLKAQSEYSLEIRAEQTKSAELTITTNEKLVQSVEKPDKHGLNHR